MLDDKEMTDFLSRAQIADHSPDLAARIIAGAMASGHASQHRQFAVPQVKQKASFSAWWGALCAQHGQKMAVAAAFGAIAIIMFDPAGKVTQNYVDQKQMAEADRYTVDGMPLLTDVALMEEPDLYLEELVAFNGQG